MQRLMIKKLKPRFIPMQRIHQLKATSWENALGRREIYNLETRDLETYDLDPQQLHAHPVTINSEWRQHVQKMMI